MPLGAMPRDAPPFDATLLNATPHAAGPNGADVSRRHSGSASETNKNNRLQQWRLPFGDYEVNDDDVEYDLTDTYMEDRIYSQMEAAAKQLELERESARYNARRNFARKGGLGLGCATENAFGNKCEKRGRRRR